MGNGRLVLGLDPGLAALGYGVVRPIANGVEHLEHGCIRTRSGPLPHRLQALFRDLTALRSRYPVTDVAMEATFYVGRLRSQRIGEARGVAVLAAVTEGVQFVEYTPTQVKEAVTGSGGAGKRQVQEMVRLILALPEIPTPDDAADALAVAVCHARRLDLDRLIGNVELGAGISL